MFLVLSCLNILIFWIVQDVSGVVFNLNVSIFQTAKDVSRVVLI